MRRQIQSQHQLNHGDDDVRSSPPQILDRMHSKDDDRRRRTIIIEKKNGTFGFTLQSYGIHYKKEQEIEMITYVDYVEYDGPAYRAGMKEGDVILSINGTDMEKADHKTLVNFIKNCDTRMRMVVSFEDCVRKVELHIRYIQLQRILQCKMNDLEKLCLKERQLLEGKWKTHSLPARKKATSSNGTENSVHAQTVYSYCRPTVSTEDVGKAPQGTQTIMLAYQYLDPHYRTYVFQPSTSNSGEYLLSFESPRLKSAQHHFIVKTPCDTHKPTRNSESNTHSSKKSPKNQQENHSHSYRTQLCNSCMQVNSNNIDNASLEAYDLASPCCDPHCVPSRRRSRNQKEHHRKNSKSGESQENHQRQRPHSQINQSKPNYSQTKNKYFSFNTGLVSQCSLHSCTSSELSGIVPTAAGESSAASYTTSLSTDTLYWENTCDSQGRRHSKSMGKVEYQQYPSTSYNENDIPYTPSKPKSWDNLTTKAYGGYGFGYGYVEGTRHLNSTRKDSRTQHTKNAQTSGQYIRTSNEKQIQTLPVYTSQQTQCQYIHPTKSTDNLLSLPKFTSGETILSDSSLSCECLEATTSELSEVKFFPSAHHVPSPLDINPLYCTRRVPSKRDISQGTVVTTTSEITRL